MVDRATAAFDAMIADQHASGATAGDHFAKPGANDRVWNALEKLAVRDPDTFVDYYANDMIALISRAWLGPGYQVTSQVNVVRPGGQRQDPHRDYHLGFLSNDVVEEYPTHVHLLSPVLTLQGAVAHSDMPVESGPTMYLPYSHQYDAGYLAWRRTQFRDYFLDHYVQLPLAKGDAAFFNPALFHGAGTNVLEPTSNACQPAPGLLGVRPRDGGRRPREDLPGDLPGPGRRTGPQAPTPTLVATPSRRPPRATRSRPTSTVTSPSGTADSAEPGRGGASGGRRELARRGARRGVRGVRRTSAHRRHLMAEAPAEALAGKVVLVSGGTQGLGAAVARAAARDGATVAVTGRRREVGEAFAAELTEETGREVFFTPADVGDVAQATVAVRRTVDRFGRVDCLVNVAGFTDRGSLVDTTPELFDRHIAVNLKAPFFLMQAVVTRPAPTRGAGLDRQRDQHVVARRSALPRALRRCQGRPRRSHPQRGSRPSLGPDPDQRPQHRLDRHRAARTPSSADSTTPTTTGLNKQRRPSRWGASAARTRSPTPWCSCCPTAAVW